MSLPLSPYVSVTLCLCHPPQASTVEAHSNVKRSEQRPKPPVPFTAMWQGVLQFANFISTASPSVQVAILGVNDVGCEFFCHSVSELPSHTGTQAATFEAHKQWTTRILEMMKDSAAHSRNGEGPILRRPSLIATALCRALCFI
eukprot:Selendium_serpulae@DN9754_c0_g1_i1.p2